MMYRLYVREWVTVHTERVDIRTAADPPGPLWLCLKPAKDWVTTHLPGVSGIDVCLNATTDDETFMKVDVDVFRDVLQGEFAQPWAAEQMAEINQFGEFTIVLKDSRIDREIQQYGYVT